MHLLRWLRISCYVSELMAVASALVVSQLSVALRRTNRTIGRLENVAGGIFLPVDDIYGRGIYKRSSDPSPDDKEVMAEAAAFIFDHLDKIVYAEVVSPYLDPELLPRKALTSAASSSAEIGSVLYVNMDDARQQRQRMESMLKYECPSLYHERIRGLPPNDRDKGFAKIAEEGKFPPLRDDIEVLHVSRYLPLPEYTWVKVKTEWAILASHMSALKRIIKLKKSGQIQHNVLVLEDDAILRASCVTKAAYTRLPYDWEIFKLYTSLPFGHLFSTKAYIVNIRRVEIIYGKLVDALRNARPRNEYHFNIGTMYGYLMNTKIFGPNESCVS